MLNTESKQFSLYIEAHTALMNRNIKNFKNCIKNFNKCKSLQVKIYCYYYYIL
jgi:D-mannonate dehydratase